MPPTGVTCSIQPLSTRSAPPCRRHSRGKGTRGLPCPTLSAGALLRVSPATGLTEQQLAAPNTNYGTFAIFRHISVYFGVFRRNGWHTPLQESSDEGGLRGGLACLTSGVIVSLMAP
jgi:hypothetical protein